MTTLNFMTASTVKTKTNYLTPEQVLDALLSTGFYPLEEVKRWGIHKDPEAIKRYLATDSLYYAANPEEFEKGINDNSSNGPFNTVEELMESLEKD